MSCAELSLHEDGNHSSILSKDESTIERSKPDLEYGMRADADCPSKD